MRNFPRGSFRIVSRKKTELNANDFEKAEHFDISSETEENSYEVTGGNNFELCGFFETFYKSLLFAVFSAAASAARLLLERVFKTKSEIFMLYL